MKRTAIAAVMLVPCLVLAQAPSPASKKAKPAPAGAAAVAPASAPAVVPSVVPAALGGTAEATPTEEGLAAPAPTPAVAAPAPAPAPSAAPAPALVPASAPASAATASSPAAAASAGKSVAAPAVAAPGKKDELDVSMLPFTPDSIKKVVVHHQPKIQACYEGTLLGKKRPPEGMVVTSWTITSEGHVANPKVQKKGTTLRDSKLHDCVVMTLAGMTFPKPPTGLNQPIEYPFNLKAVK